MRPLFYVLIIIFLFNQIYGAEVQECESYKNTEFRWWDTDCGKNCHEVGTKVICNWFQYHQGCFCKNGFYRNRMYDCVPIKGCHNSKGDAKPIVTPLKCPKKEKFQKCGNQCMKQCDSLQNPLACSYKSCDTGCFCNNGLYRNDKGLCVTKDKCKRAGSVKAFYVSKSVSFEYKRKHISIASLPEDLECGKNEDYTSCGDGCSEKCENIATPEICPLTCQTGCFCKPGFFRTKKGVCVPQLKCPKSKFKHKDKKERDREKYIESQTKKPPKKGTKTTTKKPKIADSKVTADGQCRPYEEYSECGNRCKELCENAGKAKPCPPNMKCETGCFCTKNYFRNSTDYCVLQKNCDKATLTTTESPIKCGPNEKYTDCGSKCSESCSVFTETTPKDCPPNCDTGCFCLPGFYRDQYKQCVPQDQCECDLPPLKCFNKNEEYTTCGVNCRKSCSDQKAKCPESCGRGCFCKEDYMRDDNGVCVLEKHCSMAKRNESGFVVVREAPTTKAPMDCGENEKYSSCGNLCEDFCDSKFDQTNCPMTCEKGCFCNIGYKRNAIDICVLIKQCKDKPKCGKNEEYADCGQNCGRRCKDIGRNTQCPLKCEKGCFCKRDYFRDPDGSCIKRSECVIDSNSECADNEVYAKCGTHCGETCEDLLSPIVCPKDACEIGCFCDKGLYRDLDGKCVTKEGCNLPTTTTEEPICEQNEEVKHCGNKCEESCEESSTCKRGCEKGCFCVKDYLRNKKGKCVPGDKCKGPEQCAECKDLEYYTDCGSDCGRLCSDIGKIIECNKVCNRGCFCKYGFYRTQEGDCVPKNQCPIIPTEDTTEE